MSVLRPIIVALCMTVWGSPCWSQVEPITLPGGGEQRVAPSVVRIGDSIHVTGALLGLPPNTEVGFHIHEKGDCSAPDASSAGGHFNPTNTEHGDPQGAMHHGGDMLNAKSDAQGTAQVDVVASGVSLTSGQPDDVHGKAIVLHEKRDDYKTQPSGDSGKRIACGVIH